MNISVDAKILQNYEIDQDQLSLILNEFINNAINSGLNLQSLKEIRFVYDYSDKLIEFQRTNGLYEGHSVGGVAKAEHIFSDDSIEHYVFCHYAFLLNLLINEEEFPEVKVGKELSLNGLFHELCHVHDDYLIYNNWGFLTFNLNNHLDNVLYSIALSLWNEFFAHLVSMHIYPIEVDFRNLKEELLIIESEIKLINQQEKVVIYQMVHKYLEKVVRIVGNVRGSQLEEDELFKQLEGTVIHKHYKNLTDELRVLSSDYPNWRNSQVLNNLTQIVKNIWEDFGFVLSRMGNDFFIIKH